MAIAELARRQHGVVARRQLERLGLGRGAIEHRLAAGRLHRLYVGVYAVGHVAITLHGRWMAAVLACGPGGLLSHRDGAALWGVRQTTGKAVDVTAAGRSRRGHPGIALHLVREVHPDDWTVREGIPVTTVPRTLLDLAEVLSRRQLEHAFEAAERLRLLDVRAVEALRRRSRGRHGLRPLAAILAAPAPAADTRSELERRFVAACSDTGLPAPATNVVIAGLTVDAAWPAARLVVELDGYAFHRTRAAFERDRSRDAALQLAGYRVIRITRRRLEQEPEAVMRTLRSLLR